MEVPYFKSEPYVYDRSQPPLFFTENSTGELDKYGQITREYFRLGSKPGATHLTMMSNGMTLGEVAMLICRERNTKRKPDSSATPVAPADH